MNRKYLIILIALVSCQPEVNTEKIAAEIMNTDKAFSEYSIANGYKAAFIEYADEDAIIIPQSNLPIVGIEALKEYFEGESVAELRWAPLKSEAAKSGDLGYTFGNYTLTTKDSLGNNQNTYGTYMTIWKLQGDGSWKYVLDGGNTTQELFTLPE